MCTACSHMMSLWHWTSSAGRITRQCIKSCLPDLLDGNTGWRAEGLALEKRPLRARAGLHLGRKGLLQCFEKCSACSGRVTADAPACSAGPTWRCWLSWYPQRGGFCSGLGWDIFTSNLKGRKKGKERDTVLRNNAWAPYSGKLYFSHDGLFSEEV